MPLPFNIPVLKINLVVGSLHSLAIIVENGV
jgi:hypothetical protein